MHNQQPISSFQEENDQINPQQARNYNNYLIKQYFRQSPLSILFFLIMFIMFIISTILTYLNNNKNVHFSIINFNPQVLIQLGANAGFLVKYGQVYRLVTAIFLHAGAAHFALNATSIFGLLMPVEAALKFKYYFMGFFIGGIQGNLLSCLVNFIRQNNRVVAVGASTSICSILGLYLATIYLKSLEDQQSSETAKKQIKYSVSYLVVISILPGIDFFGHMGSFAYGVLQGLIFPCLKRNNPENTRKIKKIRIFAGIILLNYTIVLLSMFFF